MPGDAGNPYDAFAEIHAWRFSLPGVEQNRDIPFYISLARETGGPVLELACGSGRVAIPLARAGFEVTGLDLSERMLAMGRQKLLKEPPEVQARVRLLRGDMTDFTTGQRYPLILIPFNSLQLLHSPEDQRRALACAARHLAEGSRLVLEVNAGFKNLRSDEQPQHKWTRHWREKALTVSAGERVWQDVQKQVTVFDMIFETADERGRRERVEVREMLRWTSRGEVKAQLRGVGLRILSVFGDFERGPVARPEGRLVVVAVR
jgi:SAM-dependent methyltransferase